MAGQIQSQGSEKRKNTVNQEEKLSSGYEFKWLNPGKLIYQEKHMKWEKVLPKINQTFQQRLNELLSYTYNGSPSYIIRRIHHKEQTMTPKDMLELLRLLSAVESWGLSSKQPMPDYLADQLSALTEEIQTHLLSLIKNEESI